MRLMHLSDLHLGKNILEHSLIEDQRFILEQILDIVKNKKVDLVLIVGDVYDKGIPNVEAVRLFSEFLSNLYRFGVKVCIISGNHDSKDRLSFGNELFVDNGVYIEGVFDGNLRCVELDDEYGKILIYMLPFIRPADVRGFYSTDVISSYDDAVRCVIENTDIDSSKRNVIMVHQFVTAKGVDIDRSDSENLSLGGIDNVDISIFDCFDYVAMGHIHRAQKLVKDTARYSGSPLKYSFSEVNHNKSVPIIELKDKGNIDIELVPLSPLRDMRIIQGKLENLLDEEVISVGNRNDYINVVLTDDDYVLDAIGKLRRIYPNILKLEYRNRRSIVANETMKVNDVSNKSVLDLFKDFYKKQNYIDLDDERLKIVNRIIKDSKENFDD